MIVNRYAAFIIELYDNGAHQDSGKMDYWTKTGKALTILMPRLKSLFQRKARFHSRFASLKESQSNEVIINQ